MDNPADLPTTQADFLGTIFARLGQIGPDPSDVHFGLSFRVAGTCPSIEELRARVATHLDRMPKLTERLVARATVYWEPDPSFDIANHVHVLPRGAAAPSARELLGTVNPMRPPWGLWASADDDCWHLHYVVHHARQDAAGAVRTVTALLGDGMTTNGADRPRGRGWPALVPISPDLGRTFLSAPPVPRIKPAPGRALGHQTVEVALLTEVAARTGAAVNQVHLAAMSAALDRWLEPVAARRLVNIPVDTRRTGDDDFANELGFMRVALPSGSPDDRLRAVLSSASRRRAARYRRAWRGLARPVTNKAATWAAMRLTDHHQISMTLSSLRVDSPLILMDAPVLDMTTIPWLPPGHTCFAFLVTYGEQARLSVLAPDGAPDPAALASHWRDAVRELHHARTGQPTLTGL